MAPILNHGAELHQRPSLWILAGTGEGPLLAEALLQQGWRLQVSLVTAAAAAAYQALLSTWPAGALELQIGALEGPAGIAEQLRCFVSQGRAVRAVVDATHPFAQQISRDVAQVCASQALPLLRLTREGLPSAGARLLPDLQDLDVVPLAGVRLLLALGSRQLSRAVACSPGALHHARVLSNPEALQLALAAGLAPYRIACLRPSADFALERALLRRWRIEAVVCRQSGGRIEALWQDVSRSCGCQLLLLQRPSESPDALPMEALLSKLKQLLA